MTALEIGQKLVELCNKNKAHEVVETLYSQDIATIEASSQPGQPAEQHGIKAVLAKGTWWEENHTVHSSSAEGPYPHGNRFIVKFTFDITNKPSNKRFTMSEMALYTVQNGKIVREEFFYVS
jgi:ketosteroid isomerase-like protein